MENISLLESFSEFKDEKLIDRVTLMVILEEVFRNSLTRKFGTDENFDIIINPDKGDLEIWRNRIVVKDGEVEDPNAEIEITQARKIEPDFEVGEEVSEEFKLIDLGRRSIQALRQNLVAKVFEHDSNNIYNQFKDRVGEIFTAEVHHVRAREVILLDDDGNELPWNGKDFGHLLVRGPFIASKYMKGDGGQILDNQGFFDTGDVATIDELGFMQITDRSKDVIKSGGEWISSIELENIAVGHPDVAEAAVIGIFHPKWDERPLLVVVPVEGKKPSKEELIKC